MILEKGVALTSYFEKEENIIIKQGNPYIIIIARKDFFSFECLEKNCIEGKTEIARKFFETKENHYCFYKLFKNCSITYFMQIDRKCKNNLKTFFFGSENDFRDLERIYKKEGIEPSTVFKVESNNAIARGAIYYCCLKMNDSNSNIDNPYALYNNVYQMIDNNVIFKTEINKEPEKYNPKVIVSIDFGTSGIDYCFAFNTPGKIEPIHGGLSGTEGRNCKSSTDIIIDKECNTIKFGNDCKEYISNSQLKEEEYYFTNIKMHLYENLTEIEPQNSQKKFPIIIIISKILAEVKKEAVFKIKSYDENITENDIKWVVTVPAIWNNQNKQIMIEASINAELIQKGMEQIYFCLMNQKLQLIIVNMREYQYPKISLI